PAPGRETPLGWSASYVFIVGVSVGRELGPQEPLIQVPTPSRGSTHTCKISQRTNTPSTIRYSIFVPLPPPASVPRNSRGLRHARGDNLPGHLVILLSHYNGAGGLPLRLKRQPGTGDASSGVFSGPRPCCAAG